MKTLYVKGEKTLSAIHVGEKLEHVKKYLPHGKVIIITDENVKKHYHSDFPAYPVITISTGEQIKNLATCEMIYNELIRLEADRKTFILGIGGGIVCDITGFVASTYMRGIRFGFVSTTLLSQVDASVGGKNGVNFNSYKNMVGLFCQPEFVICDTSLLKTLSKKEISNGFAEIVKHGLIADKEMFSYIESNVQKALNLDNEVITKLVLDSVKIKAETVQKDEKEKGERLKLNFGHTIGHALEKLALDEKTSHGRAVSMGMVAAASFSKIRGLITKQECQRISRLLLWLNLPVEHDIEPSLIFEAVKKDKKREKDMINFVFLAKIGQSIVEKITLHELKKYILAEP